MTSGLWQRRSGYHQLTGARLVADAIGDGARDRVAMEASDFFGDILGRLRGLAWLVLWWLLDRNLDVHDSRLARRRPSRSQWR